jgi:hypothetical protein
VTQLLARPDHLHIAPTTQVLTLSGNQLSGTIPPCFTSAPALQELYMSGNRLAGPLPDNFNTSKLMVFYAINQTGKSLDGERRLARGTDQLHALPQQLC